MFKIKLHWDDRPLLEYLSTRFNIGQVYPCLSKKLIVIMYQVYGKFLKKAAAA